jgi:SAM-dependent methyltransferase
MGRASAENSTMRPERSVIRVPTKGPAGRAQMLRRYAAGALLGPAFWAAAIVLGVPGMAFRAACARLAIRLLRGGSRSAAREAFRLLIGPLESTRHFEMEFVWEALTQRPVGRYLDLSSPRVLPLAVVAHRRDLQADIVNPDLRDLGETRALADGLGVTGRCRFHHARVDQLAFAPGSFDAVTSVSVIEHIPHDTEALRLIWEWVRPGGVLLLTLPCAARPLEERVDRDPFSVLPPDEDGSFFFQWVYDDQWLEERVFAVTGRPRRSSLWGEVEPGALKRRLIRRWGDTQYPIWREPLEMRREFRSFDQLSELPGEGVIGLEFVRP